jgi:outer membrane autotransporter protein
MSENAFVETINIMRGAQLHGDIISHWNPDNPHVQWRAMIPAVNEPITELTFGYTSDTAGRWTSTPDSGFFLRYEGNILGADGLAITVAAGELQYSGRIEARKFTLDPGATLSIDFDNGKATSLNAGEITLASGSNIEFAPRAFDYGQDLGQGPVPVLELNAATLTNNAALSSPPGGGAFSVGPYDYTYSGVSWNGDQSALQADISSRAFNHRRGGTDAAAAPLALAARSHAADAAAKRLLRRFATAGADKRTGGKLPAIALLGLYQSGGAVEPFRTGVPGNANRSGYASLASVGGSEMVDGQTGVWFSPGYSHTRHRGSRSYDVSGFSLAMGVDHWFGENLLLGLGLGLDMPRYDSDDDETEAIAASGFLYAGIRLPAALELGLSVAYSGIQYQQKRSASGIKFDSDFNAALFGFGLSLARPFALTKNLILRPVVSHEYLYFRPDHHSEVPDAVALRFEGNHSVLNRIQAGMDMGFSFDGGMSLSGKVFYSGMYGDRDGNVRASFVQDPLRNSFSPPVDPLDKHSFGLAAGIGIPLSDALEFNGDYTFLRGNNSYSHQAALGLNLRF